MAYIKHDNYPSLKTPGVYPDSSIKELGLYTDNLEKFSLGNWNSIVRNNRKFFSPLLDPSPSSLIDRGRPVYFYFKPTHIISYDIISGNEQGYSTHA